MEPIAIVTVIALLQYAYFSFAVGKARQAAGISAPAIIGNPEFERIFRVHQNTLEQLAVFLPALWLFGWYVSPLAGALIGIVFVGARFIYNKGYTSDPSQRGTGFIVGFLANMVLVLGSLLGAAWSWIR